MIYDCTKMSEEANTSAQQPSEEVSELRPDTEEAAATSAQQPASMEKDSEPQQDEAEATQQPVSSEKADGPEQESEEVTSIQQPEKASEPQQPESEEAKQPISVEKASEPQQPESEEAKQPASLEKASEPQQLESEEAKQPASVEKDSDPQTQQLESDREATTPAQQPESMEKASGESQKPESTEAVSVATTTQGVEEVSEPGQAESGEGASKSEGGGWVTADKYEPAQNARVAPEVEDCQFCRIVVQLSTAYEVYRDDDFVCFEDRNPVSTLHYLLVPRKHYQDLRSLTVEHLPLLARMVELAKIVLKERRGDPDDVRMGFHLPPFLRVPHLHMHIISPASRMSWLNRNIVFRNDSFAFVSPTGAVNYLKKSSK